MIIKYNIILVAFLTYLITASSLRKDSDNIDDTTHKFNKTPSSRLPKSKNVSKLYKTFLTNSKKMTVDNGILKSNNFGRSGLTEKKKLWPNATVPYRIVEPYDTEEKHLIRLAMDTIQLWTCVQFVPHNGEKDYIAIADIPDYGCGSHVGRLGGPQIVYLETPLCFKKVGKVIHELLHVLGIIHEHARPDRDMYVNIYTDNIAPDSKKNFDKYPRDKTDDFGMPYDYSSVMHYVKTGGSYNGNITIEPKIPGNEIGQRNSLSVRDAVKIMNMYNCYYKINKKKFSSRLLPNANETRGVKVVDYNIFFRNFNYTNK